jgi:hypothetical protein
MLSCSSFVFLPVSSSFRVLPFCAILRFIVNGLSPLSQMQSLLRNFNSFVNAGPSFVSIVLLNGPFDWSRIVLLLSLYIVYYHWK